MQDMVLKGIPASDGYAAGFAVVIKDISQVYEDKQSEGVEAELDRLKEAIAASISQIQSIRDKVKTEIGESEAEIFDSHLMFLSDKELLDSIKQKINANQCAEFAVKNSAEEFALILESLEDEYIRERAADIRDVGTRIIQNLTGTSTETLLDKEGCIILVAKDFAPSFIAQLDKKKEMGLVSEIGGRTSHTSIMARTLSIPAVTGVKNAACCIKEGDYVIVDGSNGSVIINPDDAVRKMYMKKIQQRKTELETLKGIIDVIPIYKDKPVELAGNIGSAAEAEVVLENGGRGIGLFRTEFLFMDRDNMPTEDEQYMAYKKVLDVMRYYPVIIRTLDIGGDKSLPYLKMEHEENPFLGLRALRLCLKRPDILKTQLNALLRASVYGNLKIMFPMVSSVDEFKEAKAIFEECKLGLRKKNIPVSEDIEVGIMVEIPSAALCSDELAKHADFFSIGSNDLIQYTLAADRLNENVSYLYNPGHPAVLRLIKMTIDAAHENGKWCGMCGEMAGDVNYIQTLLEYGLDEFSMSPSLILTVKKEMLEYIKKKEQSI